MKGQLYKVVLMLVVLLLSVSSVVGCAPKETEALKWKLATHFLETDARAIATQDWADEVRTRSDGRIQIEVYPGETLFKGRSSVHLMYFLFGGKVWAELSGTLPSPSLRQKHLKASW